MSYCSTVNASFPRHSLRRCSSSVTVKAITTLASHHSLTRTSHLTAGSKRASLRHIWMHVHHRPCWACSSRSCRHCDVHLRLRQECSAQQSCRRRSKPPRQPCGAGNLCISRQLCVAACHGALQSSCPLLLRSPSAPWRRQAHALQHPT
jgi:hypothetical protein